MSDLPTPEPVVNPETEEFWAATAEGTLLLRHCNDCEQTHHYPRTSCPHCASDDTEWMESTGLGTVYSFTVTRQAAGTYGDAVPYVLAFVELEDGPRVLTNIVGTDPEDVEVGQEVAVTFDETDDGEAALFRFEPRG